jgi:cytochrome b6-f complex iron-sulfur subunit
VAVAIPIIIIFIVGVATLMVFVNRRARSTGELSRETRQRDVSSAAPAAASETSSSTDLEATGRERADETRAAYENVPARRGRGDAVIWEPVDEEELGVARRQFLNRGILLFTGLGVGAFGAACLGFLWPTGTGGFGGKVGAGTSISDIIADIEAKAAPFYIPEARAYIAQYPKADLPKAKKVYSAVTYAGMEQGLVALYQRCVHLGCRVPWCPSSQWFECPCHGSKYNRVGEKKAGPAPRGLDRFAIIVSGDSLTINTGDIEIGPPIGTNTTGQQQEGPLCV